MGIEGAVVAMGTLFLLAYVIPQITRRRAVFADAPIGERYSEDLRLITERTLRQEGGDHGRIFTTERTMSTPTRPSDTRGPDAAKMRAIARDRSCARARIARRGAHQQRALVAGAALAVLAAALWVAVGLTSLAPGFAIAATAVGGLYLLGVGYLVSSWAVLNTADEERIAKANKVLRRAKRAGVRDYVAARPAAELEAAEVGLAEVEAAEAEVGEDEVAAASAAEAAAAEPAVEAPAEVPAVEARPARKARPARVVSARVDVVEREERPADVPSYTLKAVRRTVKPYEAPEAPVADVPFRPTRLGERIGDGPLEAANPAPAMTGNEEFRADVLGGGSTLDALLDRRRA